MKWRRPEREEAEREVDAVMIVKELEARPRSDLVANRHLANGGWSDDENENRGDRGDAGQRVPRYQNGFTHAPLTRTKTAEAFPPCSSAFHYASRLANIWINEPPRRHSHRCLCWRNY